MIDSRKIEDLSPEAKAVCEKHIVLCTQAGVSLLVYSTYRDHECQNALYKIGRTLFPSGKKTAKVTNARGGQSWHNFRCAWDCVGLRFGKPVWKDSDPIWKTIVRCGIEAGALAGFYWEGDLQDTPHFEVRPKVEGDPLSLAEARIRFEAHGTIFV